MHADILRVIYILLVETGKPDAAILGFADDLPVVVTATPPEDVEVYMTETVRAVKS